VYYPNWRIYKNEPPSSLKLGLISHVFYSFAWVKPDGTVHVCEPFPPSFLSFPSMIACLLTVDAMKLSDEWADSQIDVDGVKGCLRSFQNLKTKHSHLKVVLSVGGGGKGSDNFAAVAANHASRERFAHTARELVNEYGLDGIDSNTTPPTTSSTPFFTPPAPHHI